MTIQPGTDIGRYHILEQLGEGGMAVVYKAYDTRLESEVALKFIRTERLVPEYRERTLKRFQIEAKKMAQLQHPNIVKVMDYGEYEGAPYLVMAYLPGGTLKSRLGQPMPWVEAARLLKPITDALNYAHSKEESSSTHKSLKFIMLGHGNNKKIELSDVKYILIHLREIYTYDHPTRN